MHQSRSRPSLGQRAADSGVPAALPPDDAPAAEPTEGRHCWVHDPPGTPGRWPGLLVEWRQRGGTWQGRVAYTVAGPHGPALVEAWLPAERLQPR